MLPTTRLFRFLPLAALTCLISLSTSGHAWETEGHRMINRLAVTNLPPDTPEFLRTPTASDEIEWLAKLHYLREGYRAGKLTEEQFDERESRLVQAWLGRDAG